MSIRMKCRDCDFIDERGELDKCPYCRGDDWKSLKTKKKTKKKKAKKAAV